MDERVRPKSNGHLHLTTQTFEKRQIKTRTLITSTFYLLQTHQSKQAFFSVNKRVLTTLITTLNLGSSKSVQT